MSQTLPTPFVSTPAPQLRPSGSQSANLALRLLYQQVAGLTGDGLMAQRPRSPEAISWSTFDRIMTGLVGLAIVVIGAGFAWLHSDLGDLRTDIRDIRGSVVVISGRIQDTREDMLKASAAIERQIAVTNTKLDDLIGTQRRRP